MEILFADIGRPDAGPARRPGAWLEARVMTLFAHDVAWQPGARELLAAVRAAGLKTALVTATGRPITEVMLDTMGRENFDVTITERRRQRAASRIRSPTGWRRPKLGVATGTAWPIEDSPLGIASAVAAGCVVLAVPSEVDLSELSNPAVTIVPQPDRRRPGVSACPGGRRSPTPPATDLLGA